MPVRMSSTSTLRSKDVTAIQTLDHRIQDELSSRVPSGQPFPIQPSLRSPRAFLAAAVTLALVLRLIVVALAVPKIAALTLDHNAFGSEMGWTARSIALGHGFSSPFLPFTGPTALVPPVYPYVIAAMFRLFGLYSAKAACAVLIFNSLCSALTCIPIFFLVRQTLSSRLARIAALAWSVYPFAIYFSAACVWDYALTALLFTCCLLAAQRLHLRGMFAWIGFGILYGLAVLSNPSIASMLPFLLGIAMYKVRRFAPRRKGSSNFFRGGLAKGLVALLAFLAVCTPWNLRNTRVMHAHFFLRDGFWIEFYAGNNGDAFETNSAWAHPASNPVEMAKYETMGEIAYAADKHHLAADFVSHHPGFFLVSCVHRVVRFWTGFWSFSPKYLSNEPLDLPNFPFCCFLLFMMIRGLHRWWQENESAALPYLIAVLIFPLPYYLTHASMDYRQPLEPVIVILVIVGLLGTGATAFGASAEPELEILPLESSV